MTEELQITITEPEGLSTPLLSKHGQASPRQQEEAALAARIHSGDESARHELFARYNGFAYKRAQAFSKFFSDPDAILQDLVSAAQVGLLMAIDQFHPERYGNQILLATSVPDYMLSEMAPLLRNERFRGMHMSEDVVKKLNAFRRIWFTESGALPDTVENRTKVAQQLKITISMVGTCLEYCGLDVSVSTDQPIASATESELTLGDTIADPTTETDRPLLEKQEKQARKQLRALLIQSVADGILSEREYDIFTRRAQLDGSEKQVTLEELADQYGITRERVRQIGVLAQDKLLKAYRVQLTDAFVAHAGHLPRRRVKIAR